MLKILVSYKKEIIIVAIFMFFALGFNVYRVQSDGLYYYSFMEKMLRVISPESPAASVKNERFFQAGCAFFNAPFYLTAYGIEKLFQIKPNFSGITLRQIFINLSSNFYMILSLILAVKILKRMSFRHIILPISAVLFSTTAFAAAVVIPSFSHAVDIFITTLFIYLLLEDREGYSARPVFLGALVVVAVLVRQLNFVLIILAAAYYFNLKEYKKIRHFLLGFLMIAWVIPLIYYIHNGTISFVHETGFSKADICRGILFPKNSLKFLLHPLHGLFVWSPVTILSAVGLTQFPKGREKLGYLLLGTWIVFLIMHGFIRQWHAGWSFSNRYLAGLFPIYIAGLAAFCDKYGRKSIPLVSVLLAYSVFLFLNWHLCIMNGEFGTPQDMVRAWVKGESPTSMDKKVNVKTFLNRSWQMCRYKYLFRILK